MNSGRSTTWNRWPTCAPRCRRTAAMRATRRSGCGGWRDIYVEITVQVIASEAKQSLFTCACTDGGDCFVASVLAMTRMDRRQAMSMLARDEDILKAAEDWR